MKDSFIAILLGMTLAAPHIPKDYGLVVAGIYFAAAIVLRFIEDKTK